MWQLYCSLEFLNYVQVEAVLVASLYVDNIMLHADPFHSHCVALVVATQATVESWAQKQGVQYNDFSDLCSKEETRKEILKSLQQVCLHLPVEGFIQHDY